MIAVCASICVSESLHLRESVGESTHLHCWSCAEQPAIGVDVGRITTHSLTFECVLSAALRLLSIGMNKHVSSLLCAASKRGV